MKYWDVNIDELQKNLLLSDYEICKLRCSQIKKDCQVILMMLDDTLKRNEEWK